MPARESSYIGRVFGRLTVTDNAGLNDKGHKLLRCSCECGNEVVVVRRYLVKKFTKSCGCLRVEHCSRLGKSRAGANASGRKTSIFPTKEYRKEISIYHAMMARCNNDKDKSYRWYGARGIRVCSRWTLGEDGYSGWECFMFDMGPKPSPDLSIDREDNNGDYSPSNCRWATKAQQTVNRRPAVTSKAFLEAPRHQDP